MLPIPASPSGPFGTASNPLGSPAQSVSNCVRAAVSARSLLVTLTNSGFAQPCYGVPVNQKVKVTLFDGAVNSSTGLPLPVDVAVARLDAPVVGQYAEPSTPSMPGLTMPGSIQVVNIRNALFDSPLAASPDPISFYLPPLQSGTYLLQSPNLQSTPSAVLVVAGSASTAVASSGSGLTTTPATPNEGTAKAVTADAVTAAHLVDAFDQWEMLPATCSGEIVPGTLRVALMDSSGVLWAEAQWRPVHGCRMQAGPDNGSVPPDKISPWSEEARPIIGVFEKLPGQVWTMNDEAGSIPGRVVFPCAVAPGGQPPSPGNGAIPAAVLKAWHMTPQSPSSCAAAFYPYAPR